MHNRREIPLLSSGEIAELIAVSNRFTTLLNRKRSKTAQALWDESPNLRLWFRGEDVWSTYARNLQRIPDEILLMHLNSAIHSEHNIFFKYIFDDNQRLHALIKALPDDQSAHLLVNICRAYRRHGDSNIISLARLMSPESINQALTILHVLNTKNHCQYLDNRIALLQSQLPPVTPIFSSGHFTFFTPAATITPLPDAFPVPEFDMTDAVEWNQNETSAAPFDANQPLNDNDLQEWLEMLDKGPGLHR